MSKKSNSEIREFLEGTLNRLNTVNSEVQLLEVLNGIKNFGSIDFDNTQITHVFKGFGVLFVCLTIPFLLTFFDVKYIAISQQPIWVWSMSISFAISAISGFVILNRNDLFSKIKRKALLMDIRFDNNLRELSIEKRKLTKQLMKSFTEFHRGNHDRKITRMFSGSFVSSDSGQSIEYRLFTFKWVNQRTVVEVKSDGKGGTTTSTRTVYDTYHRFGVIIPFPYLSGVTVQSSEPNVGYKKSYQPASLDFRKQFNVSCDDPMNASKFLCPIIVEGISNASSQLEDLNVEVGENFELLVSTSDEILESTKDVNTLDIDGFIRLIEQQNTPIQLGNIISLLTTIIAYSDSNF